MINRNTSGYTPNYAVRLADGFNATRLDTPRDFLSLAPPLLIDRTPWRRFTDDDWDEYRHPDRPVTQKVEISRGEEQESPRKAETTEVEDRVQGLYPGNERAATAQDRS